MPDLTAEQLASLTPHERIVEHLRTLGENEPAKQTDAAPQQLSAEQLAKMTVNERIEHHLRSQSEGDSPKAFTPRRDESPEYQKFYADAVAKMTSTQRIHLRLLESKGDPDPVRTVLGVFHQHPMFQSAGKGVGDWIAKLPHDAAADLLMKARLLSDSKIALDGADLSFFKQLARMPLLGVKDFAESKRAAGNVPGA
jgi:hypothetical protein